MNIVPSHALNYIESNPGWHRLRLFNYYRGTLALFFLTIFFNGWIDLYVSDQSFQALLFLGASIFYLLSFIIFIFLIERQKPSLETQTIIQTCIDISVIIIITHAFSGINSGLGMLLIINISMTSLFLPKRFTLLLAAVAALAILGNQIYSQLAIASFHANFVQSGILGMIIFAFAFTTSSFSRRLLATEQLANEQERELETVIQLNEHIIHNMRTGIIVLSPEGLILMSNNAAESIFGNIKLLARTSLKDISPNLFERFTEWQANKENTQSDPIQQSHGLPDIQPGFSAIEKDKSEKGLTLVFLEDASQLNQRFQQVKLASLGRLTASIAHEIRNPLAAIQHASQLLEESVKDPANIKLTQIINSQTQRINGVVKNVLQLSKKQRSAADVIYLNDWLKTFKNEFCPTHRMSEKQIEIKVTPEMLTVTFDSEQLHQVLWNLCSNSINHSGIDPHRLLIRINGQISGESHQPIIEIVDNGQGIDEQTAAHIFEPFFTTSTEGTGLGLYIIKEIVENNRAKIELTNQQGRNNCFKIHFMQPDTQSKNKLKPQEEPGKYVR